MYTIIQVVYYHKNTGSMTKDALRVGIAKKFQIASKLHFSYVTHCTPIPYRILKTRPHNGISDIQPKKHGPAPKFALGAVDPKNHKFELFCTF